MESRNGVNNGNKVEPVFFVFEVLKFHLLSLSSNPGICSITLVSRQIPALKEV